MIRSDAEHLSGQDTWESAHARASSLLSEATRRYSDDVLAKARRASYARDAGSGRVLVRGSGGGYYTVRVIPYGRMLFAWCSCANGLALGGNSTCYHSALAVVDYIAQHGDDLDESTPTVEV